MKNLPNMQRVNSPENIYCINYKHFQKADLHVSTNTTKPLFYGWVGGVKQKIKLVEKEIELTYHRLWPQFSVQHTLPLGLNFR